MNQILKNILVFFIGCILGMSANMGIGSQEGVKEIDGIPFLIIFKM